MFTLFLCYIYIYIKKKERDVRCFMHRVTFYRENKGKTASTSRCTILDREKQIIFSSFFW